MFLVVDFSVLDSFSMILIFLGEEMLVVSVCSYYLKHYVLSKLIDLMIVVKYKLYNLGKDFLLRPCVLFWVCGEKVTTRDRILPNLLGNKLSCA